MAPKETYEEKHTASNQTAWMAKFWKDTYFQGIDATMKAQEEAEQTMKDAIAQSFAFQRDVIKLAKQSTESWISANATIAGTPNPMAAWTKQAADASNGGAEATLKTAEETLKNGFALYEKTLASTRKQARELSDRLFETVVPG